MIKNTKLLNIHLFFFHFYSTIITVDGIEYCCCFSFLFFLQVSITFAGVKKVSPGIKFFTMTTAVK